MEMERSHPGDKANLREVRGHTARMVRYSGDLAKPRAPRLRRNTAVIPPSRSRSTQQFLRSLPRDARRAFERCLAEGVLTDSDLTAADPAKGAVPIAVGSATGTLELLPFFAPGLILGRVMTADGRFTLMISDHHGVYHAFVGINGDHLTGDFPTFAAAWAFALHEGFRATAGGKSGEGETSEPPISPSS